MHLSLPCLIIGHDDMIRRKPTRMYLECQVCNRETRGWLIENKMKTAVSAPTARRVVRLNTPSVNAPQLATAA